MKLAIIGAGASGLASLKYGLDEGHDCDVYEQAGNVGGVWNYREETADETGRPVFSPMYQDLTTNLPKEAMTLSDFPYPPMKKSHIPQAQVLDYFKSFVGHFDLERYIKFHSRVTRVKPLADEKWSLTVHNAQTATVDTKEYDAVFVCSGHFNVPQLPKYPGQATFEGAQLHSIFYRKADEYRNKRVLIVGNASSGIDIARLMCEASRHVYISYRSESFFDIPKAAIRKPDVSHFDGGRVVFVDDTTEYIDVVIYCTGYNYDFPFLTKECGITVQNNWVRPLYKNIINIERPTMYFIGLPQGLCVIPMFDLQARFALASLTRRFDLPTRDEMKSELYARMDEKRRNGLSDNYAHRVMGPDEQEAYFRDLATTARIKPIPAVINNIFKSVKFTKDLTLCYNVLDDENFTVGQCE